MHWNCFTRMMAGMPGGESDPSTDDGDAPGLPGGESDAKRDCAEQIKRRPGRPVVSFLPRNIENRAARGDVQSQAPNALRRNKLNDERKGERALQDVAKQVSGAAAAFAAALQTPGGQKAFPDLIKASSETKAARDVASAVVVALSDLIHRPARAQKSKRAATAADSNSVPATGTPEVVHVPPAHSGERVSTRGEISRSAVKNWSH